MRKIVNFKYNYKVITEKAAKIKEKIKRGELQIAQEKGEIKL